MGAANFRRVLAEQEKNQSQFYRGEVRPGLYLFIRGQVATFWSKSHDDQWIKQGAADLKVGYGALLNMIQYLGDGMDTDNLILHDVSDREVPKAIQRDHGLNIRSTQYHLKKTGQIKERFNVYLEEGLYKRLNQVAEQERRGRSTVIEQAVADYIDGKMRSLD